MRLRFPTRPAGGRTAARHVDRVPGHPTGTPVRRWSTAALAAAALIVPVAGCQPANTGSPTAAGPTRSGPATTAPSTAVPSTPAPGTTRPSATPSRPAAPTRQPTAGTAATDLAAYLADAQRLDDLIHVAVRHINGTVTATQIRVDDATSAAVVAMENAAQAFNDPVRARLEIPAGLNPALLRATLLVHSDLVDRAAALRWFAGARVVRRPSGDAEEMLRCLGNGGTAAQRFDADLASLRTLAGRYGRVVRAAPDSTAAAELQVYLYVIMRAYRACGSCGGRVMTALPPLITWKTSPARGRTADGLIGPSGTFQEPVTVIYTRAGGWDVRFYSC